MSSRAAPESGHTPLTRATQHIMPPARKPSRRRAAQTPTTTHDLWKMLPAEMKNQIYYLVLVKKKKKKEFYITDKKAPPAEPSLLMVSKQIREEAGSIWYYEHKFTFKIKRNDASKYLKWHNSSSLHQKATQHYYLTASKDMNNLFVLLKAFYEGRMNGELPVAHRCPTGVVARCAFETVRDLKAQGLQWDAILKQLKITQKVLTELDHKFG